MNAILPVTIIGGYLGSGKTTLVNHLLRHANGARLAVLVNDFGELPIDADLIEAQDGDIISLSGGCVCCSYGDDLSLSLERLQAQDTLPDHVFIEASGVALPGAIGNSLSLLRAYRLEGIVVLADATTIQHSSKEKYVGDTIQRQLNDADLIVLNKLDLISVSQASAVQLWVEKHYAQARLVDAVFSTIAPEVLFDINRCTSVSDNADRPPSGQIHNVSLYDNQSHNHNHNHDHDHSASSVFSSVNLRINQPVDANALAAQLADKHCGLIRAKGFVTHTDSSLKTIQVVGRRWSVTDAPVRVAVGLVCIAIADNLTEESVRAFCGLDGKVAV